MKKKWDMGAVISKRLLLVGFLFVFLQTSLFGTRAFCFSGQTHLDVTMAVFKKTKMFDKFESLEERQRLLETLMKACTSPDTEERDWLYKGHFYDPMNEPTNRLVDSVVVTDSARVRLVHHYNNAVQYFRTDHIKSIEELGKALHYMEDMCCPVHLLGWSSLKHNWFDFSWLFGSGRIGRIHDAYEAKMGALSGGFLYDLTDGTERNEIPDFRFTEEKGVEGILESYPLAAFHDYDHGQKDPTYEVFKRAYRACCEIVYLFFKDVGIDIRT